MASGRFSAGRHLLGFLGAFCTVVCGMGGSVKAPVDTGSRAQFSMNPVWKLLVGDPAAAERTDFDDAGWQAVTLPHAWNEDSAFKVSIRDLPTGIAWYRKHFSLPRHD